MAVGRGNSPITLEILGFLGAKGRKKVKKAVTVTEADQAWGELR